MVGTSACPECGASLLATDRFCAECGRDAQDGRSDSSASGSGDDIPRSSAETAWDGVVEALRDATAGEFEVLREIGRGGMAVVVLAHEIALNRKVAIKVMSPGILTNQGMVERFKQEARTVAN